MRAISAFSFETGMSTRRCRAPAAFRIRASMSAIGSVIMWDSSPIVSGQHRTCRSWEGDAPQPRLPARLAHARDLAAERHLPEADPAQAEFAQVPARPAAPLAAVAGTDAELRLAQRLLDERLPGHCSRLSRAVSRPRPRIPRG